MKLLLPRPALRWHGVQRRNPGTFIIFVAWNLLSSITNCCHSPREREREIEKDKKQVSQSVRQTGRSRYNLLMRGNKMTKFPKSPPPLYCTRQEKRIYAGIALYATRNAIRPQKKPQSKTINNIIIHHDQTYTWHHSFAMFSYLYYQFDRIDWVDLHKSALLLRLYT